MFKIIKVLVSIACLGVLVWWGLTVPLGDRTLFGHLRAIFDSKESQELVRGTKQKVSEVTRRIARDEADEQKAAPAEKAPAPGPPQEHLTQHDRQEMRRLIEARGKVK